MSRSEFRSAELFAVLLAAVVPLVCASAPASAQNTSFSGSVGGSISNSISVSNSESGLNSTFDASTSNLSNPVSHSDVSDPTHSQLLGSTLSPIDTAYANAYFNAAPQTGAEADAQRAAGVNDVSFGSGGRRSQAFSVGASQGYQGAAAGRQSMLAGWGAGSMRAAFTGAVDARAAFSGQTNASHGTELGFSGEGQRLPMVQTGPGALQSLAVNGTPDEKAGFFATDPVLSGSTSGWETGPELHGDLPVPSSETGTFFAEASRGVPAYQFDDGQTPLAMRRDIPGQVLGAEPVYSAPTTGFPDSTKGLAALPTEAANQLSPFTKTVRANSSPFLPVSEGSVYAPGNYLEPSLHSKSTAAQRVSFDAYERRLQELRLAHGMSISQAQQARRTDIREFQRGGGRRGRPSGFQPSNQGSGSPHPELMGNPVIR